MRANPILILFPDDVLAKAIKNGSGYALYGNPPRWHKVAHDKPAPANAHHVAVSHYHVAAVKKLQEAPGFANLAPHEQVAAVQSHAADLQSAASSAAAVSMWKKAAMSGKNPTPAQWKAFDGLSGEQKQKLLDDVSDAIGDHKHLHPPMLSEPEAAPAPAPAAAALPPAPVLPLTGKPAYDHLAQAKKAGKDVVAAGKEWLAANPDGAEEFSEALIDTNTVHLAPLFGMVDPTDRSAKSAKNEAPAPAESPSASQPPAAQPAPASGPNPWSAEQWSQLYLPDSNTNAPSHNKKVAALQAAAEAGDADAIHAMKFGSNTYGKKQAKIAEHLLADMKAHGGATAPAAAPAPAPAPTPAPAPAAAPVAAPAPAAAKQQGDVTIKVPAQYLTNTTEGHNKFWSASVNGKTLTVVFGKIGTKGQTQQKEYGSEAAAANAKSLLVKQKTAKGYEHSGTTFHTMTVPAPAAPAAAAAPAKPSAPAKPAFDDAAQMDKVIDAVDIIAKQPDGLATLKGLLASNESSAPKNQDQVKLKDYLKEKIAYMESRAEAAAPAPLAKPPLPPVDGFKMFAHDIQTAIDNGNESAIHAAVDKLTDISGHSPAPETNAGQILQYAKDGIAYLHQQAKGADAGPKEGDTKQGANGMLVLKNGRWVKVSEDESGEDTTGWDLDPSDTGFSGVPTLSVKLQYGGHATIAPSDESGYEIVVMSEDGDVDPVGHFPDEASVKQHMEANFGVKVPQSLFNQMAGKAPIEEEAPAEPEPVEHAPADVSGWKQIGGQKGSNPGGLYEAPDGTKWYCKFPPNPDHAKSEVLTAKLYEAAGIPVADLQMVTQDGKVGIASKWVDGLQTKTGAQLATAKGAHAGFATDAWLGNWDVVGLANDNLQVLPGKGAVRVDVGGSLEYRAQGAKKQFGDKVTELDSLRDKAINPKSAAVFGKMTDADITASVAKVAAISDNDIADLVEQFGPGTPAEKLKLTNTLLARKADLLAKYPGAKPKSTRQDPTKLQVNPAKLPTPHDFSNWNGAGKGLSSKAHVNAANSAVEQEALAVAKQGNLPALKDLKYHVLDKESGVATGDTKPIAQHPSKHVQQYHADLVQILDEVANPPKPLKLFNVSGASSVAAIDQAFPPKPLGTTVAKVKSNEKLGFWVVLGGVSSTKAITPKKTVHFTPEAVASAHKKFAEGSKLARHFITSVQASGSYNDLFRDGKEKDSQGNKLSDVAQAALEYSTTQPEGTAVYRWQNMSDEMVGKVMSAPDGTVIQATGPMCTSYSPTATKGFGKHRVKIQYAKGARAVESFGSGKFASEKEVTTLPNARFVVLGKKMVDGRLELDLLMLPPDIGVK